MPKAFDPDLGYVPCGKLHNTTDLERCDKPRAECKAAARAERAKRTAKQRTRARLDPGKPPRQKTPEQMDDDERWAFIKRCFKAALGKRYCAHGPEGCFGRIELDHILAKGDGGKSNPENAQLLCRRHHAIKHGNDLRWSSAS